jgi:hypothetical protein
MGLLKRTMKARSSDSKDGDEGNKGHNDINEESASSFSMVTEKSKNGSPSLWKGWT